MSEGFPPVDHTLLSKEPVPLTEKSRTLELLFQFTYHRMPPDLRELDFKDLMDLAEAAEKYLIQYARAICVLCMRYELLILSNARILFDLFDLTCFKANLYLKRLWKSLPSHANTIMKASFTNSLPSSLTGLFPNWRT
jgi:hypothetical protein